MNSLDIEGKLNNLSAENSQVKAELLKSTINGIIYQNIVQTFHQNLKKNNSGNKKKLNK